MKNNIEQFLSADLEHILLHTEGIWDEMHRARVFITGGTGFFGRWLLESFLYINDKLKLGAQAVVLSRDPVQFAQKAPHLAKHPAIKMLQGDVRTFEFPVEEFRFVIHAATESSAKLNRENPLLMFDTILDGTRRTLEFARTHGTQTFLLTSSGAVYGKQPPEITHIPEEYHGAQDTMDTNSAYGEGKRAAEHLCRLYAEQYGLEAKIARCFAFVGPFLPLDIHFAIGNFIRDAIRGGPIRVNGDGSPFRSYLYAADLAAWLWTILLKGQSCRPYNVGSDESITIAELANLICRLVNPASEVIIAQQPDVAHPPQRYVPSVERARQELSLESWVSIDQAVERTIPWAKDQVEKVKF